MRKMRVFLGNKTRVGDDCIIIDILGKWHDGTHCLHEMTFKKFFVALNVPLGDSLEAVPQIGYRLMLDDEPKDSLKTFTSEAEAILHHHVSSSRPLYRQVENVICRDFLSKEELMKCFKEVSK